MGRSTAEKAFSSALPCPALSPPEYTGSQAGQNVPILPPQYLAISQQFSIVKPFIVLSHQGLQYSIFISNSLPS